MKKSLMNQLIFLFISIASMAASANADQPPLQGGEFTVIRGTIDNGGSEAEGNVFTLRGTIGQHDADHQKSGGEFELRSGFWTKLSEFSEAIFIDSFE
ncbi:MAG: hypothetical protein AAGH65_05020 [Pseudomonadota bacterium]